MRTGRNLAVVTLVLVLAGSSYGQNGQVKFRGTVTVDEQNNVIPVCYGDYHVTVAIERILDDPNGVLTLADSVQVCYESALHLASGAAVAVTSAPPAVVTIPKTEAPAEIPRGAKITCLLDNELSLSDTCEVIRWQGYTYWVFSDIHNAERMEVGAYDAAGNLVASWSRSGARYLRRITVDEDMRTVTLWGQADQTIVMSWDELIVAGSQ